MIIKSTHLHEKKLHATALSVKESWSFEDALFDGLIDEQARRIPQNGEHSVIWCIWHIARIEDVAMNLLVAGSAQVLVGDDWLTQMKIRGRSTGNAMDVDAVAALSNAITIDSLRAYRMAVGRRTREIVQQLQPHELKQKVEADRIKRVLDEGAIITDAQKITDYWSHRTIAGLLLMSATRHSLVHLNEALRLKGRCRILSYRRRIALRIVEKKEREQCQPYTRRFWSLWTVLNFQHKHCHMPRKLRVALTRS